MITLERVRLVGWHFFEDVIVPIGDSCLLAGDNAAGKSTIVDAVQYALSADLRKARFNAAAGDRRGGRDLASYVRCKLGSDATEYLRGDAVAHVMLEFSKEGGRFIAGVCAEAWSDGRASDHFWIHDGLGVESVEVRSDEGRPLSNRQFRDRMRPLGAQTFDSATQYRRELTSRLGVFRRMAAFNPYLEAFTRSISFSPLVSVDRFVCDYILEEQALDVTVMKANLESYKRAEAQAEETKRRIASLREVMAAADDYAKHQRVLRQQDYLKRLVDAKIAESDSGRLRAKESALASAVAELTREARELTERKAMFESARRDAEAALARNEGHQRYSRLVERLGEMEDRLAAAMAASERCAALRIGCASALGLPAPDPQSDPEPEQSRVEEERKAVERRRDGHAAAKSAAETALRDAVAELSDLERGVRRFPEACIALREALKGRGLDAWILADLAEVTEPAWTEVVEGWLDQLRFAVIVAPDDFDAALAVYDALPRSVAGVALPDVGKMRGAAAKQGSLAELVSTESPWARAFLDYELGDAMTADVSSLRGYAKAVTKDRMAYSGRKARRLAEAACSTPWLGKAAREARLAFLAAEAARLRQVGAESSAALVAADERLGLLKEGARDLLEAMRLFPSVAEAASLASLTSELRGQLEKLDSGGFKDLEASIQELSGRIREADEAGRTAIREAGRKESELETTKASLSDSLRRIALSREELDGFLRDNADIANDCERYAAERLKASSARDIADNYGSARKGMETKRDKALKEFRGLVQRYGHEYNALVAAEMESVPELSALLKRLESSELPSYMDRIIKARRDAELEFKDHFIARLSELIENARESFREINDTLKSMAFGQNQYRFSLEERQERRGQIEIVRKTAAITAYEGGLFDQLVDPAERQAAESLFDKILRSPLDSPELRSICDYRTYFSYDIRMKDLQSIDPSTGKAVELSLSKVLREKSGGEAQTPYYVAIAASFFRFFHERPEATVRLVLFDEAFDKLDDERIGKILEFYRHMGLQTVIAVPPNKLESIAPHMDRVNLVIRHGYAATVRDYRRVGRAG